MSIYKVARNEKCHLISGRPTSTNHAQPQYANIATAALARTAESLQLVTGRLQMAGKNV